MSTFAPLANEQAGNQESAFDYLDLNSQVRHQATLAEEAALAISYNGISQAVMMVTPNDLEDFVLGFSLSNRLIARPEELYDIEFGGQGEARQAELTIANRAFAELKQQRRQLAGTSGCGVCGVAALEQALPAMPSLSPAPLPPARLFARLRQRLAEHQQLAQPSGALHAAAYLDNQGEILFCREDIGRHNALDKLIGALYHAAISPRDGVVVMTSRCSLELIQKAVSTGIGTLATLSAPTALTVQWARRHQLNLIHVPHHSEPRLYSPVPVRGSVSVGQTVE